MHSFEETDYVPGRFSRFDDFMGAGVVEPGCVRQTSLDCCQITFVSFACVWKGHIRVLQNRGRFVIHTLGEMKVAPVENYVVLGELGVEELGFTFLDGFGFQLLNVCLLSLQKLLLLLNLLLQVGERFINVDIDIGGSAWDMGKGRSEIRGECSGREKER